MVERQEEPPASQRSRHAPLDSEGCMPGDFASSLQEVLLHITSTCLNLVTLDLTLHPLPGFPNPNPQAREITSTVLLSHGMTDTVGWIILSSATIHASQDICQHPQPPPTKSQEHHPTSSNNPESSKHCQISLFHCTITLSGEPLDRI